MLSKIDTKKKLLVFPSMFIIIVVLVGLLYTHYSNISNSRNEAAVKTDIFVQQVLKGRISVYQFLRSPNEQTAQKVRDDFALLNKEVTEFKSKLSVEKNRILSDEIVTNSKKYIEHFDAFASKRIVDFKNGTNDESSEIKEIISQMVKVGLVLEEKLQEINKSAIDLKNESINFLNNLLIVVALIAILIFVISSLFISSVVIKSLNNFKEGLLSFFSYLNRESSTVSLLNDKAEDEFGEMAKVVNDNIERTQKGIEEDRRLIDETIAVLGEFEQGDLSQRLNISVSNPALMELKTVLNKMASNLESNIDNVLNILEQYSQYNYLNKISTKDIKEHLLKLANGVNTLGDSITEMLIENKTNGLTLDKSSNILLENVKNLVGHDNGNTFKVILESLKSHGYHVKYQVLNSCEYGNIPQNRERIYVVCFKDIEAYNKFSFPLPVQLDTSINDLLEDEKTIDKKYFYTEKTPFFSQLVEEIKDAKTLYQWRRQYVRANKSNMCPTLTANMGTGGHNVPLLNVQGHSNTIRKLTPRECFNFQGFPKNFILPKNTSNANLYKQAGNSVVVPVVERIALEIKKAIQVELESKNELQIA